LAFRAPWSCLAGYADASVLPVALRLAQSALYAERADWIAAGGMRNVG
jgi:hypothetical protein